MIHSLKDILKNYKRGGIGESVSRAVLLEKANAWFLSVQPKFQGRMIVSAFVDHSFIVHCSSGVIASEVRRLEKPFFDYLEAIYPASGAHSLKCFLRGGTLTSDVFDDSLEENQ